LTPDIPQSRIKGLPTVEHFLNHGGHKAAAILNCQRAIKQLNLDLKFRGTQDTKKMKGKQKFTFPQTPSTEVPEDKLTDLKRLN